MHALSRKLGPSRPAPGTLQVTTRPACCHLHSRTRRLNARTAGSADPKERTPSTQDSDTKADIPEKRIAEQVCFAVKLHWIHQS